MDQLLKQSQYSEFLFTKKLKEPHCGEKIHKCVQRSRQDIKFDRFFCPFYDQQLSNLASRVLRGLSVHFGNDYLLRSLVLNGNFREEGKGVRNGEIESHSISRARTCKAGYKKRYSIFLSI